MPIMGVWIDKIRTFLFDTVEEMRKCNWPTRDQLFESTILVIIALVIATAYLAAVDQVLFRIVRFLTTF